MSKSKELIKCYTRMLLIRCFEEAVEEIFTSGMVRGTSHTCIGQEAVPVAVGHVLSDQDMVTSTHRGHGHFIGKGGDAGKMMAELFGKETGYSGGRGGSQLMADYALGFVGGNGITAGSMPVAAGMALRFKQKNEQRIALCYIGDGAVNEGSFHESMNMAGLWKLPVIYLCENNLYAMSTACGVAFGDADISAKAKSYGFEGIKVDGNDFFAVVDAVSKARDKALRGEGPTLVECMTYRQSGHSRGDKRVYRTREEEAAWRERDPIDRFRKKLSADKILDGNTIKQINAEVKEQLDAAITFAKDSDFPDPKTLLEGLYA